MESFTDRNKSYVFSIFIFILCTFAYYSCVFLFSFDLPRFDDYNDVFGFFNKYVEASSFSEYWAALTHKNNEHITLVNHLVYLLVYNFSGAVNFYIFTVIGSISVLLINILLALSLNKNKLNSITVSVLGLLGFSFFAHLTAVMSMTAISNYSVVLFAVLVLYFLLNNGRFYFIYAVVFSFLCLFSQANGVLIFPLGFIIIALTEKKLISAKVCVWLVFSLMFYGLYFYGYDFLSIRPSQPGVGLFYLLGNFLLWFFVLLGNTFSFDGGIVLPFTFGLLFFFLLIYSAIKLGVKFLSSSMVFWYVVFVLLSIVLVAFFGKPYPVFFAVAPRYKIYSAWFILGVFLLLLNTKQSKGLSIYVVIFSIIFFVASYLFSIPEMKHRKSYDLQNFKQWTLTNRAFALASFLPGASTDLYLAIANGVWDPFLVWKADAPVYSFEGIPILKAAYSFPESLPVIGRMTGRSIAVLIESKEERPLYKNVELCSKDNQIFCYQGALRYQTSAMKFSYSSYVLDRRNIPAGDYLLVADGRLLGRVILNPR